MERERERITKVQKHVQDEEKKRKAEEEEK